MKLKILLPLVSLFSLITACFSQKTEPKTDSKSMQNAVQNEAQTAATEPRQPSDKTETAILGGGCFWCTEAVYQELKGVQKVESGYSGGSVRNPTYREICSGLTGHAEVIRLTFDPAIVSFGEILEVFFTVHDPTTLNRQGADAGTQYRSVIFYQNEAQEKAAQEAKTAAKEAWDDPIVTEISPLDVFYVAEDYHQNYYRQNSSEGYCSFVITPKLAKFRKRWADKLK